MKRRFTEEQRNQYKDLIEYSQEFIDKCLLVFAEDEEMKELLEEKSFLVNAILNSEIKKENSSKEICKTLKNDFIKLYNEQYRSKGLFIENGKVVARMGMGGYRSANLESIHPTSEVNPYWKAVLEYNEDRRAAGRIAAENHIAGGGILPSFDEEEKIYTK